ncbi:MAG TPA: hypothetical protein VFA94_07570 [Acidimicrobiales bacterium]|nr:hypothetical protein [Acidimicrobiales bacterium]
MGKSRMLLGAGVAAVVGLVGTAAPSQALTATLVAGPVQAVIQYTATLGPTQVPTPVFMQVNGPVVIDSPSGTGVANLNCMLPGNGQASLAVEMGNVAGGCNTGILPTMNCAVITNRVGTILVLSGNCTWTDPSSGNTVSAPLHAVMWWELASLTLHDAQAAGPLTIGTPA